MGVQHRKGDAWCDGVRAWAHWRLLACELLQLFKVLDELFGACAGCPSLPSLPLTTARLVQGGAT